MAKFLVIGDLHGIIPKIDFCDFDAVLFTGDACDISFIRDIQFRQLALKKKNPAYKMKDWFNLIGKTKAKTIVKKSILGGRKILEKLDSLGVPVFIVPGNGDWTSERSSWDFLRQDHFSKMLSGLKNIKNIDGKILKFGGFSLVGYGNSFGPEYPQHKEDMKMFNQGRLEKRKARYEKLIKKYSLIFSRAKKPVIFLSHNTPYNTKIDKILLKESPRYGYHHGSLIAREMIDKFSPALFIGGHMHEHYGKTRLGSTICIAAGLGKDTLVETEGEKIKTINFYRRN